MKERRERRGLKTAHLPPSLLWPTGSPAMPVRLGGKRMGGEEAWRKILTVLRFGRWGREEGEATAGSATELR